MKCDAPTSKVLGITEAGRVGTREREGKGRCFLSRRQPLCSPTTYCVTDMHAHPEREHSPYSRAELATFCLALLTPTSYGVRALAAFRVVECFLLPSQKILQ